MTNDQLPGPLVRHTDYGQLAMEEGSLKADPIEQFSEWLADADGEGIYEPNAMVLSTIDPDGLPSARTVLLRGVSDHGFAFFTDYTSRKGRALTAHPPAFLVFPWYLLHRQVLVAGTVEKVSEKNSDEYFRTRLGQARRDVEHGLSITLQHYTTVEGQQRMLEILQFKLDILWSMLDAMSMAYELNRPPYHSVTDQRVWHKGIAL